MKPSFYSANKHKRKGRRCLVRQAIADLKAGNYACALGCMIAIENKMKAAGEVEKNHLEQLLEAKR